MEAFLAQEREIDALNQKTILTPEETDRQRELRVSIDDLRNKYRAARYED